MEYYDLHQKFKTEFPQWGKEFKANFPTLKFDDVPEIAELQKKQDKENEKIKNQGQGCCYKAHNKLADEAEYKFSTRDRGLGKHVPEQKLKELRAA